MSVYEDLLNMRDEKNADFESKLAPTIKRETILGIRVPILKEYAKQFKLTNESKEFMESLPHKYYDENMLHSILLSQLKDYDEFSRRIEEFLPYIDNWAVCDTLRPHILKKYTEEIYPSIERWINSKETYTCRFGIGLLMAYYLDDKFKPEYLKVVASVQSEEYYVNMMLAWYFATALAKQWDYTYPYIREEKLSHWVHNKTIQKAVESYRITDEKKELLKGHKIKTR